MAVLRKRQLSAPTIFSRNYNLIDPSFFTTLQNLWKKPPDDLDGTILKKIYDPLTFNWEDYYLSYVRGERPEMSRPWWEIDNWSLWCICTYAYRQKFDFKANQIKALRRKMFIEIFANSTPLNDDET
ncbi:hypothetical protein ACOSQ3_023055 [Xanthoceras sorbifolium]